MVNAIQMSCTFFKYCANILFLVLFLLFLLVMLFNQRFCSWCCSLENCKVSEAMALCKSHKFACSWSHFLPASKTAKRGANKRDIQKVPRALTFCRISVYSSFLFGRLRIQVHATSGSGPYSIVAVRGKISILSLRSCVNSDCISENM